MSAGSVVELSPGEAAPRQYSTGDQERLRVLVVDDDPTVRASLEGCLQARGWRVAGARTGEDAVHEVRSRELDVVLLDLLLPGMSGIEVLRQLKAEGAAPEIVVVTGEPTVDSAIEAMRLGAYDYVKKPVEAERIQQLTERAAKKSRLARENELLRRAVEASHFVGSIVSESSAMREVLAMAERVAGSDAPVLVTGETGSGKGLVAKKIHALSGRRTAGFVHLNCGGLQEQLVESELFGHERGAFTGAVEATPGLFEVAHGGTLFLDEVTELDLAMQSKLLQVLDSSEVRRVGGTTLRSVDVRVLAATNCDIDAEVATGSFREDLFFRLNVVRIEVPPLRERRADIQGLATLYLERFGGPNRRLSQRALDEALAYAWPGNVRELANTIQRAVLLSSRSELGPADLRLNGETPAESEASGADPARPESLRANEKRHVRRTLGYTDGNRAAAARILGIDIKTLRKKIRDYGIGT